MTHHSPFQVFAAISSSGCSNGFDGSPGTAYQRHSNLPVSASKADRYPRTRYSAPPLPMSTLPLTTRGAPVIVYGKFVSVVCVVQISFPVFASSAINRPSSAPRYNLPFHAATPRFTTSQHASAPLALFTCGSYSHSFLPV